MITSLIIGALGIPSFILSVVAVVQNKEIKANQRKLADGHDSPSLRK